MACTLFNCERTVSSVFSLARLWFSLYLDDGEGVVEKNQETVPLFEEFNFFRDRKIHEGVKQKYPPSRHDMIPKQAQLQPQRACPAGMCQGISECGGLVSCGDPGGCE